MRLLWITLGVLVVDQVTKVIVRLNMSGLPRPSYGVIGGWLRLTYTENPGMAFGIMPGSTTVVTVCSLIAMVLIIVYMMKVRSGYKPYTMCLAAILGGAAGNIVDRLFYGPIFGYGPFFEGRVVDFIHFNIWAGLVPDSVPLIGGEYVALFPIFNVADIAICGGVAGILIFQKEFQRRVLAGRAKDSAVPVAVAVENASLPDQP